MVLFRPRSSEAIVLKRTAETVKQPLTVKPSTKAPTVNQARYSSKEAEKQEKNIKDEKPRSEDEKESHQLE